MQAGGAALPTPYLTLTRLEFSTNENRYEYSKNIVLYVINGYRIDIFILKKKCGNSHRRLPISKFSWGGGHDYNIDSAMLSMLRVKQEKGWGTPDGE